ncbi:ribosome biogenesis GTPase Der [Blattabacterium sp. (Blaberus giganteus)]|uniref:ribosome biogenesis GTPase Der n=1 Tax=Blattabacterium sp. (Blaberus giganteus) TaxID=1186051 RepID=UPI00025F6F16|nr:ribosome biogenesis GTPase Der [Blattabacterium sp. (Blaberus giganteus)]AFJ90718.1 GTP-binding protein EngA [Blattabacterium sp. (Blaberus giganteus)]
MNYIVSIIGRPNVGKSTLFNRLVGRRKAIVHVTSGITRDRIYGNSEWNGIKFSVVDTGGFYISKNDVLEKEIKNQIFIAIKESDVILFLVDIKIGILDADREIAKILRKCQKIILLVVNKVDNVKSIYSDTDFFYLGFEKYYYISAINGSGTGELLDKLIEIFKKEKFLKEKEEILKNEFIPRFSIIGRPNVGKSTLINSFLNKNHHIVTSISGTTRDSLDVLYKKCEYECILVDTPGVRKKSKIKDNIEFYSTMRTFKTIEYADVCLLMVDAYCGWERQDMNIFKLVEKNHKGIIILINKWDLFHKNNYYTQKDYEFFIRKKIYPFYNVPILFISAKNKDGIHNILPMAYQVLKYRKNRLKTNILNKIMLPILKKNPPTTNKKNKYITIKYCTQLPSCTPKFIFFSNFPQYIKESYKRFVENKIRYYFDFIGVPIQIFFRKK